MNLLWNLAIYETNRNLVMNYIFIKRKKRRERQVLSTTAFPFMYIHKTAKKKRSQLHILNLKGKNKN